MTARHGVALIGLGMAVTPHAKSLRDLSDRVEVRAAMSRSQARQQSFAKTFDFPVTGDFETIIDDPAIDIVLLLTPPNARCEFVQRLAEKGKHILMEKPVERTTEAAVELVDICEQAGVQLGIVFQHRFREASMKLAQMLAAGDLGDLAVINLHVPWWRPQSYYNEPGRGSLARDGGGVLISQAIHSMDLLISLVGLPSEVTAFAGTTKLHQMETEDFVGAGWRFANGAVGAFSATTAAFPGQPETIEIVGTKAAACIQSGALTITQLDGGQEVFGETQIGGGGADPMAFPHDWHKNVITDFLDAVDENRAPGIPGREALKVHRLIDALLQSSTAGRAVQVEKD
ncbi:MAG: Gfo/Idh/MocA family oxidoreductase [Pseudomonadota bacterium]